MGPPFALFKEKAATFGYKVFDGAKGPLNLNIVGWRRKPYITNKFNDILSVYWNNGPVFNERHWPITTFPGAPWLLNPASETGTAILVPGQYRASYQLGTFKKYPALLQIKPVKVYRDLNRDSAFDMIVDSIEEGVFGVHIHKAGYWSKLVGLSSAGCQVFQKTDDFNEFIELCTRAVSYWGNIFSYTLLEYEP